MEVKVTVNLEELKRRLCPKCKEAMDSYIKELAANSLSREAQAAKDSKE